MTSDAIDNLEADNWLVRRAAARMSRNRTSHPGVTVYKSRMRKGAKSVTAKHTCNRPESHARKLANEAPIECVNDITRIKKAMLRDTLTGALNPSETNAACRVTGSIIQVAKNADLIDSLFQRSDNEQVVPETQEQARRRELLAELAALDGKLIDTPGAHRKG